MARAETPVFDERFIGFGMTRNTQVMMMMMMIVMIVMMIMLTQSYEMFLAGYTFSVLNNLFLNHWGLQKRETRPHWRQMQVMMRMMTVMMMMIVMQHLLNNRLFKGFAKELTARYNK